MFTRNLLKYRLTTSLYQTSRASFVAFKGDRLKHKGKGEEEVYFSEQERNVLKKLLSKMEAENKAEKEKAESSSDDEAHTKHKSKGDDKLEEIFQAHGVKDNAHLMDELKKWKDGK